MENTNGPIIDECGRCYDEARDTTIYNCVLSDDLKTISGYTDDGSKARYFFADNKWYYGAEISRKNLIPFNELPKEKLMEITRKGSEAQKEKQREKYDLNAISKEMLAADLSDENIDEILGKARELLGDQKSAGAVMIAKMIQTAYAGSFKAAEFVRDTAGYKPRNEVEINADIITQEDRSLIDKLNKRLSG